MMSPGGSIVAGHEDINGFLAVYTPSNHLIRTNSKQVGVIPKVMLNILKEFLLLLGRHPFHNKVHRKQHLTDVSAADAIDGNYLDIKDNEVWKVIQNGNSKKRVTKGKDGVYRVLPPTTQEEQFADEKERKARTLLLMAVPKEMTWMMPKMIWGSHQDKFCVEKGYDRFQKLLSQLDALGAGVTDEDANHKFLSYHLFTTNADDVDLIHEDLDQIDDLDLEEMDINWQIAMTAIKIKKFYKKTGRRPRVDGKMHVAFDKRKVECFNCHNTGHFARECKFKGSKEGNRQEAGKGQNFKPVQIEKEALMTIDEGQINWVEQTADEELNHALMAFTVNNEVSMCSKFDGELGAVSDASSTHYSTCQSNDSDGELGTVSNQSVNDNPIPIPSVEQVTIATQKTQPQVPKPKQPVDPSCAQHVKTPRQQISTPVTFSPIPSNNRQNWNQRMERELGAGYSFERKPCFVCGSLSHLIKDCDYYEKKMAREAALKSKRVVHADVRQATPAWTNTNRVNKANQFTPRPVQLSNIRPNLSTASKTIKTGRVNVNTGHGNVNSGSVHVNSGTQFKSGASRFNTGKQHVNSGSVHVNSGTQFKSGASRFNTGKQHVNSGSVHVNSGTQFKSGASRFNTGKQHVNSGSVHVNTARVNRPVSNNTSPKPSQVNLKSPKKCFSKQRSPVNRPFSRNTAHKSNKYAVKGKMGTAVKTSAGCVWRKVLVQKRSLEIDEQTAEALQNYGVVSSILEKHASAWMTLWPLGKEAGCSCFVEALGTVPATALSVLTCYRLTRLLMKMMGLSTDFKTKLPDEFEPRGTSQKPFEDGSWVEAICRRYCCAVQASTSMGLEDLIEFYSGEENGSAWCGSVWLSIMVCTVLTLGYKWET
ncbi:ribonuclease H-like domain-containing protein [Tanacetum coccineum]